MDDESVKHGSRHPMSDVRMEQRFQVRDSCFTHALKSSSVVRSLYSLVHASLIFLFSVTCLKYYLIPEVWHKDMQLLQRSFAQIHIVLAFEVFMNIALVQLLVPSVKCASSHRLVSGIGIIISSLILLLVPVIIRFHYDLHEVMAVVVIFEQTRLVMKTISFLYENLSGTCVHQKPTRRSLLYFLFAPTLIYQHSYPISNERDWKNIAVWIYEIFALMWCGLLVLNNGFTDAFAKSGQSHLTSKDMFHMLKESSLMGPIVSLAVSYAFLHSWLNLWAELLLFGDRLFYKDWTTCDNSLRMLRLWNFLIHSWIKEYIYKPVARRTSTPIAILTAFTVSFLVHDYCVCLPLRMYFFYYTASVMAMMMYVPIAILFPSLSPFQTESRDPDPESPPPLNIPFFLFLLAGNVAIVSITAIRYFETHS